MGAGVATAGAVPAGPGTTPRYALQDRQAERWAFIRAQGGGAGRSLAIFVHGFLGDHMTTWGRLPELLLEHAPQETALAPWDFLFVGYPTRAVASYLDIAEIVGTQWRWAATGAAPFDAPYARLALFGHSLGTLGLRQLLCAAALHPPGMLGCLRSVTLLGTPLNGSPLAGWRARLVGGKIAAALKPANPQLRMLHTWSRSVHTALGWQPVQVVLASDDQVVGNQYAELVQFAGDAQPATLLNGNHRSLVKPSSWQSSQLRDLIVTALR